MKFFLKGFYIFAIFLFPFFVFASYDYTPLQDITMPNESKTLFNNNMLEYLANIYTLVIAIAGALAVVKIVYAGIKYMTSEAFGLKTEAKKEIQAALIGLLMILGSYVFLYTLNPKLTVFNLKIVSTKAIVGDGKDSYGWASSTVSKGKSPTPGVNTPPASTKGTGPEIIPPLPTSAGEGKDTASDALLPPKIDTNESAPNTGNETQGLIPGNIENPDFVVLPDEVIIRRTSEPTQAELNQIQADYPNKKISITITSGDQNSTKVGADGLPLINLNP